MNWSELLSMGGYAVYVWGSYGLLAAAITVEMLVLLRRERARSSRVMRDRNDV